MDKLLAFYENVFIPVLLVWASILIVALLAVGTILAFGFLKLLILINFN